MKYKAQTKYRKNNKEKLRPIWKAYQKQYRKLHRERLLAIEAKYRKSLKEGK